MNKIYTDAILRSTRRQLKIGFVPEEDYYLWVSEEDCRYLLSIITRM